MSSLYIPIFAFFCEILLLILFFGVKRVKNNEVKIFSIMLITGLIDSIVLIFMILCNDKSILNFINRFDIIILFMWMGAFFLYIWYNNFRDRELINQKFNSVFLYYFLFNLVLVFISFILPVEVIKTNSYLYTSGALFKFLYFIYFFYLFICFIVIIINKKIFNRKNISFYVLLLFTIVMIFLRKERPDILIYVGVISYINLVVYNILEINDVNTIEKIEIFKNSAVRATNVKEEFLSNMSHEVRTPLNVIDGLSLSLLERDDVNSDIKSDIKDIRKASSELLDIINGVLDISKIEANEIHIAEGEYDTTFLFNEIESLVKSRIGEKDIDFKSYIDKEMPNYLYGDAARVKQIIMNLLTNAVKFTDKGSIDLKVSTVINKDVCKLVISVYDTGCGIKKEKLDKLFDKFDKLDQDDNTTVLGTGLGLSITKELVDLMHGNISVESEYGRGSKFTVTIPQRIVEVIGNDE